MLENFNKAFLRMQFGFKNRMRLYRKLSKYLSNGFQMSKALDEMYSHAMDSRSKFLFITRTPIEVNVLDDLKKSVANGTGLAYALRNWVPNGERMIIEGGEKAGRLSIALDSAIQITGTAKVIRNTLVGGLAYPLLLVALTIGYMAMFGTMVIPAFEEVLPREQWTGIGGQMSVLSDFVHSWLIPSLAVLGMGSIFTVLSMPRWKKGLRIRFDRYPPYSIYRIIQGSAFMLTVSGMLRSGIPLVRSFEILAKDASPWYRERLERTLHMLNSGNNLGDALKLTGYEFPDRESINELRAYSEMSNVEEALEILANDWLKETVEKIVAQTAVMKNVSFIFLGATFGWIMMGIFSIQQQIAGAVN
jgi:type II secretory pathway component PulF